MQVQVSGCWERWVVIRDRLPVCVDESEICWEIYAWENCTYPGKDQAVLQNSHCYLKISFSAMICAFENLVIFEQGASNKICGQMKKRK
jgi:hypothetical protein